VTELTQPLAAAQSDVVQSAEQPVSPKPTTFSELVYVHFDWWHALRGGTLSGATANEYRAARAGFEQRHGEIVSAYWCSHVESAVALTHKRRRLPWASPVSTFHRESDWATQEAPEIAAELHRCDELAVRAKTVLTGVRQVICMQLVMACAAHLLSLVDARVTHDVTKNAEALERERKALTRAETYYKDAANGQAQVAYFVGMASVAAVLGIGATIWLVLDWSAPVAALVAGALGAVVSVIQRINQGKFSLEYDSGRLYAMFLGGLRPLIGGAFALVLSFAFTGGLLNLPVAAAESDSHRKLALLVVAFVAGFSERWAQDTLAAAMPSSQKSG
jgi:cytochrome c biogenesis protein CcdA